MSEIIGTFSSMFLFVAMTLNDIVPQIAFHNAIVIDAKTNTQIKDAKIVVDGGVAETKTIWDGSFSINIPFKQLRISKEGYLIRKMNYEERTDTITLLNNLMNIDEVVIWGKRPTIQMDMNQIRNNAAMGVTKSSGISIDFFETLDRFIHAKKYKMRKKSKKLLENY